MRDIILIRISGIADDRRCIAIDAPRTIYESSVYNTRVWGLARIHISCEPTEVATVSRIETIARLTEWSSEVDIPSPISIEIYLSDLIEFAIEWRSVVDDSYISILLCCIDAFSAIHSECSLYIARGYLLYFDTIFDDILRSILISCECHD